MAEREKFTGALLPRFWEELRSLPMDVRALAAWLITNRHNDAVPGLALLSMATIADDLNVSPAELERLWRQLPAGFVEVDQERRLVRIPNQPRHGHSPNHRVIRLWWRHWQRLPSCPMRTAHVASLMASLKADCGAETMRSWEQTFGTIETSMVGPMVPPTVPPTVGPTIGPTVAPTVSVAVAVAAPVSGSGSGSTQSSEASSAREGDWARVLAEWQAQYIAAAGEKPTWDSQKRHFPGLRRIVADKGADEVCRRIAVLFKAPPPFLSHSTPDLATLVQHFDKLAVPARAPPSQQPATSKAQRILEFARRAGGSE